MQRAPFCSSHRTLLDHRARSLGFLFLLLAGCGDEGEPVPGYNDPCSTPMAPVLSCPVSRPLGNEAIPFSIDDACAKLVACGVLADELLVNEGQDHRLDYAWCARRLRRDERPTDPCAGRPYTAEQVQSAVRCIQAIPCTGLGLDLSQKLRPGGPSPELDRYECPDGEGRRTATVCDQGLLSY